MRPNRTWSPYLVVGRKIKEKENRQKKKVGQGQKEIFDCK